MIDDRIIELITSSNYKDRMKGEYLELKGRYERLEAMVIKYRADVLDFTPSCSLEILENQLEVMGDYLRILEERAAIEDVDLEGD